MSRRASGTVPSETESSEQTLRDLRVKERATAGCRASTDCLVAGVKYLLKSLGRATGMEDATKKGPVQEFFYKKLQRRPGQPMAEWVGVFQKAVLDMKSRRAEL